MAVPRSPKAVRALRSGNWIVTQPRPQLAAAVVLARPVAAREQDVELEQQAQPEHPQAHSPVVADAVDVAEPLPRLSRRCRASRTSPSMACRLASPILAAWPKASGTFPTSLICRSTLMMKRGASTSILRSLPLPKRSGNSAS